MSGALLLDVPVELIVAGDNDREKFRDDEIARLAASIAEVGLLQPPTLRRMNVDGGFYEHQYFEIVAGERRFRAVQLLGWSAMRALVEDNMDDLTASKAMLAENTGRVELDPIEEGRAYAKRIETGSTVEQVAAVAGVSTTTVERRLELLKLAPAVAELVSAGTLTVGFADLMRGLDVNRQVLASQAMLSGGLDWYAARRVCDRLLGEQQADGMFDPDSFLVTELISDAQAARRATRRELLGIIRAFMTDDAHDLELRTRAFDALAAETPATTHTTGG